jgi:hypothetical protein
MKWLAMLAIVWIAMPILARPDTPAATAAPGSTAEQQFKSITAEYDAAMKDFMSKYQTAKTDEERQKIYADSYPQATKYSDRLLPLAKTDPKAPIARDVYIWLIEHNAQGDLESTALKSLAENWAADRKVAEHVAPRLQWAQSPEAETLLRAVSQQAPDREHKAHALLSLGVFLKNQEKPEAEKVLEQVASEYKDIKSGDRTVADAANAVLFEARNLVVGKTAPEITGEDINGKPMKLSDFKGKVVVLDFFGDW